MTIKPWGERPIEEANLLNPAFCCVTLASSVIGYKKIDGSGIPYPLAFMVIPIVLHKSTSELLPKNTRTSLASWIQENTDVRIQFAQRVIALKPHTREAIMFGLNHGWLILHKGGRLQTSLNNSEADRLIRKLDTEAKVRIRRAGFVGKWFASAGSAETVMALWGIRP